MEPLHNFKFEGPNCKMWSKLLCRFRWSIFLWLMIEDLKPIIYLLFSSQLIVLSFVFIIKYETILLSYSNECNAQTIKICIYPQSSVVIESVTRSFKFNAKLTIEQQGPNPRLLQVCYSTWNWAANRLCSNNYRWCPQLMKTLKVTFS